MRLCIDTNDIADYERFLRIKSLPKYRITPGAFAEFPDEYAQRVGCSDAIAGDVFEYEPLMGLFDYQQDIAALAIKLGGTSHERTRC